MTAPSLLDELTARLERHWTYAGYRRVYRDELPAGDEVRAMNGWAIEPARHLITITTEHAPGWPPQAIAREYLRACRMDAVARTGAPRGSLLATRIPVREPIPETLAPPAFRLGNVEPSRLVPMDLRACYATLYLAVSPDCYYDRAVPAFGAGVIRWLRAEEWVALKEPRNALWGSMMSTNGNPKSRPPSYAPHLTALVMDCLHAVAYELRGRFGAVGWEANDRVWMPAGQVRRAGVWLRTAWGLDWRQTEAPFTAVEPHDLVSCDAERAAWLHDRWQWSGMVAA